MAKYRVLVSCDLGHGALERLRVEPEIETVEEEIDDEAALARAVPGFSALIVRSNVKVTRAVLLAGKDLVVVGRAGIGTDNIDVSAATRLGIAVVNAPGGNTVTTAEHTLAMLLSLARNIPRADRSMRAGLWEKKKFTGRELSGKTLGVVGAGRVGSAVAERARGMKMRVVVTDPYLTPERSAELGVTKVELPSLLAASDFITLHTPLTPETKGLLGADNLALCKTGAIIVNCARGELIDLDALHEAILSGRVGGAAIDVYPTEPPPPHPLFSLEQVVMTPHLGASTFEAQEGVGLEVAENVVSYLYNSSAPNLVNAPIPEAEGFAALHHYLGLAEKIGKFLAQSAGGPVQRAAITCRGEEAAKAAKSITAAVVRGILSTHLSERVNMVNSLIVAGERGMAVSTATSLEVRDFVNLVEVDISGSWGSRCAEGTLFGKREPKLVTLDGYRIDAKPDGEMVLIYNRDVPGVIGSVGECLGARGVNLAGFYNGREAIGGRAIILLNVDTPVSDETLMCLRGLKNVLSAARIII